MWAIILFLALALLAWLLIDTWACKSASGLPLRWRFWSKRRRNEAKKFWIERVRSGHELPHIALENYKNEVGAFYLRGSGGEDWVSNLVDPFFDTYEAHLTDRHSILRADDARS